MIDKSQMNQFDSQKSMKCSKEKKDQNTFRVIIVGLSQIVSRLGIRWEMSRIRKALSSDFLKIAIEDEMKLWNNRGM